MFSHPETIFNIVLLLAKLMGVLPYDHVNKKISYFWATYSLIVISICTIEGVYVIFDPPLLAKNSLLRNILFRCQMLALYACTVSFNLCILIHRKKISLVFHDLEKLRNETRGAPGFLIIFCYFITQWIVIFVTALLDRRGNMPLVAAVSIALSYYYVMISLISAGTLPFVAIVQVVSAKMEHLVIALKSSTSRLYSHVILYDRIVSLLTSLNEAFSLQFLLISFVSFFNLTINMYFIADYVVNEKARSKSKMVPVYLGWIIMFSSMVILPVYSCQRFAKQAKEFNTMLYQLMIDDTTNDTLNNKKLRLHIAMKREVVFTACGFFNLDYTLIHSMIAAATTYLVILIQFGQPSVNSSISLPANSTFLTTTGVPV